ncbi:hypothetical protein T06_2552 [Trichinella sp. T6]|nr:hypothetical protein T06_2552 [Trichinella sp. T6]
MSPANSMFPLNPAHRSAAGVVHINRGGAAPQHICRAVPREQVKHEASKHHGVHCLGQIMSSFEKASAALQNFQTTIYHDMNLWLVHLDGITVLRNTEMPASVG